jgi:hypothetical protein
MPVGHLEGRAAQMAKSLAAAARGVGLSDVEIETVRVAFDVAMRPRLAALDDDHHPAYLHPGRSMLILLHDVGRVDTTALVAAALHDSLDLGFRVAPDAMGGRLDEEFGASVGLIPRPGDERLIEKLVGLPESVGLAGLAEYLDQLRHLHLRDDTRETWPEVHVEVLEVWQPYAARCSPRLATRYAHWARVFTKRIRRSEP